MNKKNIFDVLIISLKLLIVCAGIALLVAFVNDITKDKIADNQRIKTEEALKSIYGENAVYEESDIKDSDKAFKKMYLMYDENDEFIGYCASVSPMGFKAEIDMLVAADTDKKVIGVKITGMSETSGIGTKAAEEEFLNKFIGKTSSCPPSSKEGGVDIIAGATKSSKPVIEGVDLALKIMEVYNREGKKGEVEQ